MLPGWLTRLGQLECFPLAQTPAPSATDSREHTIATCDSEVDRSLRLDWRSHRNGADNAVASQAFSTIECLVGRSQKIEMCTAIRD